MMRFALLTGLLFAWIISQAESAHAAPPNVVILLSDDQAWNDYGFMKHPTIKTPRLDKLAQESALFTRGYVPNSLCRPSLATIITGKYPHGHRIVGNDPRPGPQGKKGADYLAAKRKMIEIFEGNDALPELLAGKGYISFQSGKWWEGSFATGGFTAGMTHGDPARGGRHGDIGLTIGRQTMKPVLDFIDEASAAKKPFFLWYAPMLPHDPHNPPQRLLEKYKDKTDSIHVARYWAMVEWWDETCGTVLDQLEAKGVAENTIVIYITDNGWIQDPKSPRFAPRSKRSPYDGGLRTPVMIRWPGKVKPMRDDRTLVSSIDVMPTLLAACGLEASKELPGVNLLPLCGTDGRDEKSAAALRTTIYGDVYDHDVAVLDSPKASLTHRWCIDGAMKLILPRDDAGEAELYDVVADPLEKDNLAKKKPESVEALRKKIDAWLPL